MRIELVEPAQNIHICETNNAELAILWLKEWLPIMATPSASTPPWAIYIWPSTPEEYNAIKAVKSDMTGGIFKLGTSEQITELSMLFHAMANDLARIERKENGLDA